MGLKPTFHPFNSSDDIHFRDQTSKYKYKPHTGRTSTDQKEILKCKLSYRFKT